ncbi:MAG TPA: ribosome maturation factor RimM [Bosea sp. (in: a-proteobacteria)]|jgi:16S rRNA processing protein RimM|uniref:ribosome maturation factor RimM n=1 Tax=Bosea sp. (in: a-proteobacteria) TaxID=1871050 RepID=UPI002E1618AB|nr:ribosome maturation factor RimM [Bosea sp. (in: a-proteobacteria)]HEV7260703.1 ribosome maturation factor RimM [Bosea sp. (in: a-proteobacteria)]
MAVDDTLVLLGVIGAAHGIKGEVRIKTFTGDPLAIADYGPLSDDKGRRFEIADVRPAKEVVVARLKGVTSREAAESLNGVQLFVARDQIPEPDDEDEFLQADLIGCAVIGPDGATLGTVTAVENYGAGDLLDIALPDGRSVLMPFTKAFAPRIDISGRRIEAVPPEGLFEAEDDE